MYCCYFDYDEKAKKYTFFENTSTFVRVPVYLPLGTFLIQFLNTEIDTIYIKSLDYNNGCENYIFNLIYSSHPNIEKSEKIFKEWISDLKKALIDSITTNTIVSDFEYFFINRTSINLSFHKYSDCDELYTDYHVNNLESILMFEYIKIKENQLLIKKCANCGKYFIPSNRSDEIYCDNIFRSEKTCKQVGYEEKEKKDPFKVLYAKARKTQHARIRYNIKNKPNYKEDHYIPWRMAAEKARDHFKLLNDIDGFRQWIEDNKDSF